MAVCEFCDVRVKDENLRKHYSSVHPGKEVPKTTPPPKRQPRQPLTRKSKKLIAVLAGIVALIVIALVYHGPVGLTPPDEPFPCITSEVYHIHVQLSISDASGKVTIPANIGISYACMEPLHTHDTSGTIHVESDTQRTYSIGDFFKVWGRPFGSPTTMLVNGSPITPTPNTTLQDGQTIELRYSGPF